MKKPLLIIIFLAIFLMMIGLSSCTNYFTWRKEFQADPSGDSGTTTGKSVDTSVQTLCDIERSRTRDELLKRYAVGKFREFALKVSRQITDEDVSDLKRMETSERADNSSNNISWEVGRRRGELVTEIYTGAMIRAGFKPLTTTSIAGTNLSVTVGVDQVDSGNTSFVGFIQGHLSEDPGHEGTISEIALGSNPDQSRYSIGLRRFTRMDIEPDGTQVPVYTTLSLFDASEESLPHYCLEEGSALNQDEFNTIPGLNSSDELNIDPPSMPSVLPSSLPSSTPVTPIVLPTNPAPSPRPAPVSSPVPPPHS